MPIPTNPVDRNLPKGPNFLAIVIGFAVAIVVILLGSWIYAKSSGKSLFPVHTHATPSQTRVELPKSPYLAHTA